MKIILALLMTALFSFAAAAQGETAEKDFTKNFKKFKVEKYAEGEDASSGSDYLVYKRGSQVVKIRTVWSSSAGPDPTVEDVYYKAGAPVLLVKLTLTKRQVKSVVKGSQTALPVAEKFYFKDSKLVKWLEKGKTVPANDPRWAETETDAIASAKGSLETYSDLKEQ